MAAIRRLAELTFDHHESHPDFIRLVSIENIHRAEHLAGSKALARMRTPAIDITGRILERGYAEGVFRREVDAIDVHMMISAFCVFRVANQHTFGTIFGRDLMSPEAARALPGDARRHGRRLPARRLGTRPRTDAAVAAGRTAAAGATGVSFAAGRRDLGRGETARGPCSTCARSIPPVRPPTVASRWRSATARSAR